ARHRGTAVTRSSDNGSSSGNWLGASRASRARRPRDETQPIEQDGEARLGRELVGVRADEVLEARTDNAVAQAGLEAGVDVVPIAQPDANRHDVSRRHVFVRGPRL